MRGADGFQVAHFAYQDHVRILTERSAQRGRKRRSIDLDFALVDIAFFVAMQEFDGIFDGDDVLGAGRVDAIDHCGQRGGLAGAGYARDQHQAARHIAHLLHHFGQVEFVECTDLGGDDAQYQAHVPALLEDVHTEAAQSGDAVGHIDFRSLFEFLFLPGRHHAESHSQHVLGGDAGLVGQRLQFAVDPQVGIISDLEMQVRSAALHGDAQQVIDIHSTLPPFNLSYDGANRHLSQDDLSNGRAAG